MIPTASPPLPHNVASLLTVVRSGSDGERAPKGVAPGRQHSNRGGLEGIFLREADDAMIEAALVRRARRALDDIVPFKHVRWQRLHHGFSRRLIKLERFELGDSYHGMYTRDWVFSQGL
jgi:hypothetical protein